MGQMLDHDTALDILQAHWNSWITEDDFQAVKAAGLNHVRCVVWLHSLTTFRPLTLRA